MGFDEDSYESLQSPVEGNWCYFRVHEVLRDIMSCSAPTKPNRATERSWGWVTLVRFRNRHRILEPSSCATVSQMSGKEACMLVGYGFTGRMASLRDRGLIGLKSTNYVLRFSLPSHSLKAFGFWPVALP